MRRSLNEYAIAEALFIEHGITIIPSVKNEPLEIGGDGSAQPGRNERGVEFPQVHIADGERPGSGTGIGAATALILRNRRAG